MYFAAGCGADIQNFLPGRGRGTGNGKDDLVDPIPLYCLRNIIPPAHNGNAAQTAMDLGHIIIDHADDLIIDELAVDVFHDQRSSRFSGADEHDPLDTRDMGHVAQLLKRHLHHAVGKPDADRKHKAQQKPDDHAGTGDDRSVKAVNGNTDNSENHIGPGNPEHLRCADIDPDAAVELEQGKHQHRNGTPWQNKRQIALKMPVADVREMEFRPEPESEKERARRGKHIQNYDKEHLGGCVQFVFYLFGGSH